LPPHDRKRCTKCRRIKPVSDFWKDKGHTDGRSSWCSACAKKAKRTYAASSETAKDRSRAIARAYQRALARLKKRYHREFADLFATAKKDEGL
jgi:hypothetical protein